MSRNKRDVPGPATPAAKGDLVPDADAMFPAPTPELIDEKADAAVGIEDPRTEGKGPDVVSAPFTGR